MVPGATPSAVMKNFILTAQLLPLLRLIQFMLETTRREQLIGITLVKMPVTDGWELQCRFNADSTAYHHHSSYTTNESNLAFGSNVVDITAGQGQDNVTATGIMYATIPNYTNTTTWKVFNVWGIGNYNADPTNATYSNYGGLYNQTDAISSLQFLAAAGNMTSGTVLLYGVK